MKLDTDTGSLVNYIYNDQRVNFDKIEVGQGATVCSGSDRDDYTVIDVDRKKKLVFLQADDAKRLDGNGFSEAQDYEFNRNEKGRVVVFKMIGEKLVKVYKNKDTGRYKKSGYGRVVIGKREKFYDFSF